MKRLIKVLPVIIVICVVFTSVFAIKVPNSAELQYSKKATNIENTAQNIWQTVVTIIQILAVAAVVFAGLRYMFASADQKADIKKSMGILAIGAVLVFGATLVIKMIGGAANSVLK